MGSCRRVLLAAAGLLLVVSGCAGDGGGDDEAFCVLAGSRRFQALEGAELRDAGSLAETRAAVAELRDAAPPEIAGEVGVIASVVDDLAELVDDVDVDDPAAVDAARNRLDDLEERQASYAEAAAEVERYLVEECELEVEAPSRDADR